MTAKQAKINYSFDWHKNIGFVMNKGYFHIKASDNYYILLNVNYFLLPLLFAFC